MRSTINLTQINVRSMLNSTQNYVRSKLKNATLCDIGGECFEFMQNFRLIQRKFT